MVLESFVQLVEAAPTSAARCRLVLVTGDERLTLAAEARLGAHANAEVLTGLEDLRNLINTLISTVDESFVKVLREKASKLFFVPKDTDTLYFREKIGDEIQSRFADKLKELPDGASTRETQGILIAQPRFLRKEQQRVHWSSQITFSASAHRLETTSRTLSNILAIPPRNKPGTEQSSLFGLGAANYDLISNVVGSSGKLGSVYTSAATPSLFDTVPEVTKTLIKNGRTVFDIAWSTTVDRKKKLVKPKIDGISFIETTWDD